MIILLFVRPHLLYYCYLIFFLLLLFVFHVCTQHTYIYCVVVVVVVMFFHRSLLFLCLYCTVPYVSRTRLSFLYKNPTKTNIIRVAATVVEATRDALPLSALATPVSRFMVLSTPPAVSSTAILAAPTLGPIHELSAKILQ